MLGKHGLADAYACGGAVETGDGRIAFPRSEGAALGAGQPGEPMFSDRLLLCSVP